MIRSAMFPSLLLAGVVAAQAPAPATRPIDLAICLDVSGSMEGLLNAARQNLWAVVNELATLKPAPQLRVALLTYGCPAYDQASGWVQVDTGLTQDLDLVSQKLFALRTNGGDEYVARVVQTALDKLAWSQDPAALKLLFVAGNEAATQDPLVDFRAQCKAAISRGIVVNSIYCGGAADELAPAWREVAQLADGQFAAIEQDRSVVITTPFDQQLADLSVVINTTYVPFGKAGSAQWANQAAQDGNAAGLNVAAAAQRCQTKGSGLYSNSQWDLVDACRDAKFVLAEVKVEDLPEAMRKMTPAQRQAYVTSQQQKRDALRQQVEALGKQRDAHVQGEMQKLEAAGKAVFEHAVLEAVRQQAGQKGFERADAAPSTGPDSPFAKALQQAAAGYQKFVRVTGSAHVAPTDCRMPAPLARVSTASAEHGHKLYLLFARQAEGTEYVKPGEPAAVGQTLVKEAWAALEGAPQGPTEASARYGLAPQVQQDGKTLHAGDFAGLFVMHKLAADTAGTDHGWIYGTIDKSGKVTSAGAVASCIRCHEQTTEDRRFGLR